MRTEAETVLDSFYGVAIADPYRFLENLHSQRVEEWVNDQNSATQKQLKKLKGRNAAFEEIKQYSYTRFNRPHREGPYYFKRISTDARSTPGLYYQESINGQPILLVNPSSISRKDNIRIGSYQLSKDAKYLAYQFNRDGSDWAEIKVVRMNGSHTKDHLKKIKFSNISWQGEGFYYSTFNVKDSLQTLKNEEVYHHTLGAPQETDERVFSRPQRPSANIRVQVTSDERFLILREGLNYFIRDVMKPKAGLQPFLQEEKRPMTILDSHAGRLYALTTSDGNQKVLVTIDPVDPPKREKFVPEVDGMIILDAVVLEKYVAVVYQGTTSQRIVFFTHEGIIRHIVSLPAHCALGELEVNTYDQELIYHHQSYLVPPVVFNLNLETFEEKPLQKTVIAFNIKDFETKDVEYPSKDGTLVYMTILYKKGLSLNGENPTLLKAYGGFGKVEKPSFEPGLVYFLQKGGVFAFAQIRGGGEKGEHWHRIGQGQHKHIYHNRGKRRPGTALSFL